MAEVLSVSMQPEGQPYFPSSPLRRSSPSQTSLYIGSPSFSPPKQALPPTHREFLLDSSPTSSTSSPISSHNDFTPPLTLPSTSTSILSLDTTFDTSFDIDPDEGLAFPTYTRSTPTPAAELEPPPSPCTDNSYTVPSPTSDSTPTESPGPSPKIADDHALRHEPSRHVDYLSHNWLEEDIWSSWRYVVSKRSYYGERSREENATWRTWAKQKYQLRTVPPDSLNWLKDCDVTWLYGPLQTATRYCISQPTSEPPSQMSKSNSFLTKKPILKKRSASEIMLQKSLSTSSLVKQATDAIEAQKWKNSTGRPFMTRTNSDFVGMPSEPESRDQSNYSSRSTSGLQTPHGEKKHIRFDDKVEQCIAVEVKDGDFDDEDESALHHDSDSSDEGVVMMKSKKRRKTLSRSSSRSSFSSESKTIAKLPSTTLKYRTDSPDVPELVSHSIGPTSGWRPGRLSPSPSQETLRPIDPSRNFLIEDDDDDGISWDPSRAFSDRRDSGAVVSPTETDLEKSSAGMRRTPSGMFMPYDEDEDSMVSGGILGRVVDTVNTARDIAHVIWNVGWRK